MIFTNKNNIKSKSILDALKEDDYDLSSKPFNVFSCTEIIDSPKVKVLERRHDKEITVDVSDRFHTLDGSAVHYVVEMSNKRSKTKRQAEVRIFINVSKWSAHRLKKDTLIEEADWYNADDVFVSFKFDCYEEKEQLIEDYKRTSVYEAINGLKLSRVQQLNINALGMFLLGYPIIALRACLLLKDWSGAKYQQEKMSCGKKGFSCNYPPFPYKEFYAPVWPVDECKAFILERVNLHLNAYKLSDNEIPVCSKEERWHADEVVKVFKVGGKRALKVFHVKDYCNLRSAKDAASWYANECDQTKKNPKDRFEVLEFPGVDKRCAGNKVYCNVCQWCNYWQINYSDKYMEGEY